MQNEEIYRKLKEYEGAVVALSIGIGNFQNTVGPPPQIIEEKFEARLKPIEEQLSKIQSWLRFMETDLATIIHLLRPKEKRSRVRWMIFRARLRWHGISNSPPESK